MSNTERGKQRREQEEGGDKVEEMVVDGGMEDWNGFISGGTAFSEEEERDDRTSKIEEPPTW